MRPEICRTASDLQVLLVATALVVGVWLQHPGVAAVAAAGCAIAHAAGRPQRGLAVLLVLAALLGGWLGRDAWRDVTPDRLGPFRGWVTLVDDPRPLRAGLRVVADVEGERFQSVVFGSARRRLESRQSGERVEVEGNREELSTAYPRTAQARHVVGELAIERVWSHAEGTPLTRASNRLRLQLRRGAEGVMPPDEAALFAGLVIGDDTRQAQSTIDAFRRAGLSHLTAVSGRDVSVTETHLNSRRLIVPIATVLMRQRRPWECRPSQTFPAVQSHSGCWSVAEGPRCVAPSCVPRLHRHCACPRIADRCVASTERAAGATTFG